MQGIQLATSDSEWENLMHTVAYKLGHFLIRASEDDRTRVLLSLALGAVGSGIEWIVHQSLLGSASFARFARPLDTAAIGVFVFLLTYLETSVVRERRLRVFHDVQTVSELNHHVRNALETIQYAAYLSSDRKTLEITTAAVDRIDKILKELYPALSTEGE